MNWSDKNILITGGTGSFASNFINYLLSVEKPRKIVIFSRDEHKQTQQLSCYGGIKGGSENVMRGFIGDIRDLHRLETAMQGIDIVIHAAALKQVQSCEYNPLETIKTNVMGASNIVEAALRCNVDKVIGISTDKAVAPLNLYGSTKLCMERLFTQANAYRGARRTKFACTRYGNVADSRGTVVHIWKEQTFQGQALSITNMNATRFWITMREANKFVKECIELMDLFDGGEVFFPIIPSVRLSDIREAIAKDSEFRIIGDRIGDKTHEMMALKEELRHAVRYNNKVVILPEDPSWPYTRPQCVESLPDAADYSSNTNSRFLTPDEIQESLNYKRNADLQQTAV